MTFQALHSLNNFTGTFCSIIGKKHLIAFYDESPILINLNQGVKSPLDRHGECKDDSCKNFQCLEFFLGVSNFVWLNGIPILLDKIEEGMKLKFDAILIPKVGYQAILIWTGTKPQSLPILKANELLLIQEYFNIPVHCITFENGVPNVYVCLDGCVEKIPISYKAVTINDDELKSNEEISKVCSIIHPNNSFARVSKLVSVNFPGKYLYICNQINLGKSKVENVNESNLQIGLVYKMSLFYELIMIENRIKIYFDIKLELNYINKEYFLCFNVNDNNVKLRFSDLMNFELNEKSAAGKGHLVYVKNGNGSCFWHAIIFEMVVNNQETINICNFPSLITLEQDYVINCNISDISGNDEGNIDFSFKSDDVEKLKGLENITNDYSEFGMDRAMTEENLISISNVSEVSNHDKIKACESIMEPINNSSNQTIPESISIIDESALTSVSNKFNLDIKTDRPSAEASAAKNKNFAKEIAAELIGINQPIQNGIYDRKYESSTIEVVLTEFCKEIHCQKKQVLETEEFFSFEKYFLTNDISLKDFYLLADQFSGNNILIMEKHLIQVLLEEVDTFPQYIRNIHGKHFFNDELKMNFIVSKLYEHWIIIFTNSVTMYFYEEILFHSENCLIKNGTDIFFDAAFHNGNFSYVALVVYDFIPSNTALSCLDHKYYFNMKGIYKGEDNGCVLLDLLVNDSSEDIFTVHLQIKNKEDLIFFQRLQGKKDLKILIYIMEIISTCEFKILFFSSSEATVLSTKGVENDAPKNYMKGQLALYDKVTPGFVDRNLEHIRNKDPYLLRDHIAIVSKVDSNVTLSITFPNGVKLLQNISQDYLIYNNKSWVRANTLTVTTAVHFDGIVSSEVIGVFLLIWVSVRPDEKLSTYCTKYFGLPGLISSTNKNSVDINIIDPSSKLHLFNFVQPLDKNTMIFDHRGVAYKNKLRTSEVVLIYLNKYAFNNYRKNVCLVIFLLSSSIAKKYLPLFKREDHLLKYKSIVMKGFLSEKFGDDRPTVEIDCLQATPGSSNKDDAFSIVLNDKNVGCSEPNKATTIFDNYETATLLQTKGAFLSELKDETIDIMEFYHICCFIFDASRFAILTDSRNFILLCKDDICYSKSSVNLLNTQISVDTFIVALQNPIKLGNLPVYHRALVAWQGPKNSTTENVDSLFISRYATYTENSVSKEALLCDGKLINYLIVNHGFTSGIESLSTKSPHPDFKPKLSLLNSSIMPNESAKNEKGTIPKFGSLGLKSISTKSDSSKTVISKSNKVVNEPELSKKDFKKFFFTCKIVFIGSYFAVLTALQKFIILSKDNFCTPFKFESLRVNCITSAFVVCLQKPITVGQMALTHRALVAWQGPKNSTTENVDSLFISRYATYFENSVSKEALLCDGKLMNYLIVGHGFTSEVESCSMKCPHPDFKPDLSLLNNSIMPNESAKNEKGTIPKFGSLGLKSISTKSDSSKTVISKSNKVVNEPELSKKDFKKFFFTCKIVFIGSYFAVLTAFQKFIILSKDNFCTPFKFESLRVNCITSAFVVRMQKPVKVGQMALTHRALVAWQGSKKSTSQKVDTLFYDRYLSYSENLLIDKELSCDRMLMNCIHNSFGQSSTTLSANMVHPQSEAKPTLKSNNNTITTVSNVTTSSKVNKLNDYVSNLYTVKLLKGLVKLKIYSITGKVMVVSGNKGIMKIKHKKNSRNIYLYFQKPACFIDGRKMADRTDIEFAEVLKKIKDFSVAVFADVYECKKEKYFGFEFCYSVALLWNAKKPTNEKYVILKEPVYNSKDLCSQEVDSKSDIKSKAPSSLESLCLEKQISSSKKIHSSIRSLTSNKSSVKGKDDINDVKSKENLSTCLLSSMPIPIAPVARRKAIDPIRGQNNTNQYHVGMLKAVEEAFGEVEAPNKVLYPFTRERCFLYGISLYNLSLKDIVKIGCVVEFELNEYKSVNELWIGSPQIKEELTYSCVLQWCIRNSVSSTVKLKLLAAIDWIPADCDPLIKADSAFEIVTL